MALGSAASATDNAQEAKCAYPENKAVRRLAYSCLDFEPLLAGTVFQEPHPETRAGDLDAITLCSRSCPRFQPAPSLHSFL